MSNSEPWNSFQVGLKKNAGATGTAALGHESLSRVGNSDIEFDTPIYNKCPANYAGLQVELHRMPLGWPT